MALPLLTREIIAADALKHMAKLIASGEKAYGYSWPSPKSIDAALPSPKEAA